VFHPRKGSNGQPFFPSQENPFKRAFFWKNFPFKALFNPGNNNKKSSFLLAIKRFPLPE